MEYIQTKQNTNTQYKDKNNKYKERKMTQDIKKLIDELQELDHKNLFGDDFFHTWDKSQDELKAIWKTADILRAMREENISPKIFDSGLGISLFRDNSTRTRFSFASAPTTFPV